MKTMKKVLALVLVVALTAVAAVNFTLAYLQDQDEDVNTMTLGNVYIDQTETKQDGTDFEDDVPLYPAIGDLVKDEDGFWTNNNVVDKIVTVTNTGDSEAYVRTIYAFEVGTGEGFEKLLHINWADDVNPTRIGVTTIGDSQYVLYEHYYGVMQPGDSAVTLKQVALDQTAGNEDIASMGDEYKILVVSQAIQTEGFGDAETALNAGFGDITTTSHPWVNGIVGDAWDGTADAEALAKVTDDETKTVQISTPAQLAALAEAVNAGNSYAGYTVELISDIDLSNQEWTPIGQTGGYYASGYFQGTFNGNGHTISNLTISETNEGANYAAGFFGFIDAASASIKNVVFTNANVSGHHWVGVVAGYMSGEISNVTVNNAVVVGKHANDEADGDKVGGLIGYLNTGILRNNTVTNSSITGNRDVGGLAGVIAVGHSVIDNRVENSTVTYETEKDYASAGAVVSGRLDANGFVLDHSNTAVNVIVGKVSDNGLIADPNAARTYLITSAEDLITFNSYVATGVAGEGKSITAKLVADIDMTGKNWPAMNGHWVNFDGQGHTISNLTPTANSVGKNGFIGYLGAGNISNLTLKNVNVVGAQVGIFAGQNEGGSITDCKIEGTNSVSWQQNASGAYQEEWGGAGAVVGVNNKNASINVEIVEDATVTLNKTGLVTKCDPIDNYVGYLRAYTGTVTDNGTVKVIKEVEVSNSASLEQAIEDGASTINLSAGTYKMPSVSGAKEFTITGTEDTVIDLTLGAYMDSSKVSFEGVTIKGSTGYANGNGSDYAALYTPNVTYTNCTFDGPFRVGRDGATFINCTFTNLGNDYVWTYGNDVTFKNCTFESEGKALLIYSDGGSEVAEVVVENCVFNATMGSTAWAIANQNCAAIEIDNHGNGVNLTTSGNTVGSDFFSGEWRIKSNDTTKQQIIVNGTQYTTLALDGKIMTIDGERNVTVID